MTSQTESIGPNNWAGPPRYHVYVTIAPNPKRGTKDYYTGRVASTNDLSKVAGIIADDLREMGNTLGGLIDAVPTGGRVYRVFEAEWSELNLSFVAEQAKKG